MGNMLSSKYRFHEQEDDYPLYPVIHESFKNEAEWAKIGKRRVKAGWSKEEAFTAPKTEQVRMVTIFGKEVRLCDVKKKFGIEVQTFRSRLYNLGWTPEEAATIPPGGKRGE